MKFKERLKELREEKGLMQRELAEILNVSPTSVTSWEKGYNETDFTTLILIAQFFGVTVDYLLGVTDI